MLLQSSLIKNNKKARLQSDMELFRYILSHDLKKPLRLINYHCMIIEDDKIDIHSEDGKVLLKSITDSTSNMSQMLDSLSNYIKLETFRDKETLFSTNDLLQNILNNLSEMIVENNVTIKYVDLPVVYCCYQNLEYVFLELIKNSIYFVEKNTIPEINISCYSDALYHYFALTNNTPTIAEEYHEIIFTLFQRLHLEEEVPGLGAGLSIAKKIISCCEGEMWLELDNEKRNKFIFTLPIN